MLNISRTKTVVNDECVWSLYSMDVCVCAQMYAWARVLVHANLGSYGGRMRDEINQSAIQ